MNDGVLGADAFVCHPGLQVNRKVEASGQTHGARLIPLKQCRDAIVHGRVFYFLPS